MKTFQIVGHVIDPKTRLGVPELRVEAWDKDLIFDDLLGSSTTDKDGAFNITFNESDFQDLFEQTPDLFFRVYAGARLIKSTKDSILWNVNAGEIPIMIEVDMNTDTVKKLPPDLQPIKPMQAQRLAALTGLKADVIVNKTVAELSEKFKWHFDPSHFLFRRVCGRVVKKDPETGVEYPIPFATVYVEDTDFNFLSFFPGGSPWVWHFPLFIHREVIATTKTDGCGNFCVWIPRFEIDWILRWRKSRICFPIIFRRPWLEDIIPKLTEEVARPWPPVPGPDPDPLRMLAKLPPSAIETIAGTHAGKLLARAARLQANQKLGAPNPTTANLLKARAFERELPPPLPAEFHSALSGQGVIAAEGASALEGVRSAIALKLGMDASNELLANFDPHRFIGPFLRCYDIWLPQWQLILDVPDITFRVEQDINGDGVEETIYSEGFFDVRWDEDPLPDVITLAASDLAKETHACQTPNVPCGDVPAILFAGFMPLTLPAYFDSANGYALRPNRPSLDGSTPAMSPGGRPNAQTPFCWSVQLYGCVNLRDAKYYRVWQSIDGIESPITGLAWNNYRNTGGAPIPITADANGWYEVNPHMGLVEVARDDLEFPNLLLDWPTPSQHQVILKLEIGDAAKNNIAYSANVAIQVDNTAPTVNVNQLAWKFAGEDDSALRNLFGIPCPKILRGTVPKDVELVFEVTVSAHHLRDASIYTHGCGSGDFVPKTDPIDPLDKPSHWHVNGLDNSVVLHQRYKLDHMALEGSYWFYCHAHTRSMNPSGADGGNHLPTPDWNYDPDGYIWVEPWYAIAVINRD